jgi:RNase P protein component
MRFRGAFRVVRRADHALPAVQPRPALPRDSAVDARLWRHSGPGPLLMVNASRKNGGAVQRNRFRRRVRMALLQLLRERSPVQPFILWVRPAKGTRAAGQIPFQAIVGQLRLALCRLDTP